MRLSSCLTFRPTGLQECCTSLAAADSLADVENLGGQAIAAHEGDSCGWGGGCSLRYPALADKLIALVDTTLPPHGQCFLRDA